MIETKVKMTSKLNLKNLFLFAAVFLAAGFLFQTHAAQAIDYDSGSQWYVGVDNQNPDSSVTTLHLTGDFYSTSYSPGCAFFLPSAYQRDNFSNVNYTVWSLDTGQPIGPTTYLTAPSGGYYEYRTGSDQTCSGGGLSGQSAFAIDSSIATIPITGLAPGNYTIDIEAFAQANLGQDCINGSIDPAYCPDPGLQISYGGSANNVYALNFTITAPANPPPGDFNFSSGSCYNNGSFDLNWSPSSNADYYLVQYRAWTTGSWNDYNTTTGTSMTVSGLSTNTDYYFRIYAHNPYGDTLSTPNVLYGGNCNSANYNLNITKNGTGSGSVTSNPAGINCGVTCSASYSGGTTVTLTASADSGSVFTGWSGGGCSGTGVCIVTLNSDTTVTATFDNDGSCTLNSAFVTQTIAGVTYNSSTSVILSPSTVYPVTVTMTNLCDDTWTAAGNYKLGSQNPQDNSNWGLTRVPVSGSVGKNQNATFSFNITTPSSGTFNFQWRMVQDGVAWFGAFTPNLSITLVNATGTITASPNPCTVSGLTCTATVTWSSTNTPYDVVTKTIGGVSSFLACSASPGSSGNYNFTEGVYTLTLYPSSTLANCNNGIATGAALSSAPLSVVSAASLNFSIHYTLKPLNVPFNVTLDNSTCKKITVRWSYTSNGAEDGFYVYRSTDDSTWGAPITGLLGAATRSYQDTPPVIGGIYYYRVSAHRGLNISPTEVFSAPPDPSAQNLPCTANLSQSTKLMVTDPNTIVAGVTVTYKIIVINTGPADADISFICDDPSTNLTNLRNLQVDKGSGFVAASITSDPANCGSGYRFNISGIKNVATNWTITFDATFTPTNIDLQEPVSNFAVIYYSDDTGSHTKTVIAPTYLIGTNKAHVPTFREVAP